MCKMFADESAAFLRNFSVPVTLYGWDNGAVCAVWDEIGEADALAICERFGMPDRWASGPIRRRAPSITEMLETEGVVSTCGDCGCLSVYPGSGCCWCDHQEG